MTTEEERRQGKEKAIAVAKTLDKLAKTAELGSDAWALWWAVGTIQAMYQISEEELKSDRYLDFADVYVGKKS